MIAVDCRCVAAFSVALCLSAVASSAHADWAACQSKPTRDCLVEEALRGDAGPLTGKDRLDVLNYQGDALGNTKIVTAADLDEAQKLARSSSMPIAYPYALFAIRGLVAANQKQQAADLVATFRGATLNLAFAELTRMLAKAGDVDTTAALLDRMAPGLDQSTRGYLGNVRVTESVKTLAEAGKIDEALPLILSVQADFPERDVAEMQMAVAQAYAKRGDAKTSQRYFDLAGQTLEKGLRYATGGGAEQFRYAVVWLSALRGDTEATKTGLQKLQTAADAATADKLSAYNRSQYYQRVVYYLLQAKQFPLALELAKSAPDALRDSALMLVDMASASNGRIDDAREALGAFSEKVDPKTRAMAVRSIAVAMVKAGKLAAAVEMAAQINDPAGRKGALLAVALAMPQ